MERFLWYIKWKSRGKGYYIYKTFTIRQKTRNICIYTHTWVSLVAQMVKNLPAIWKTSVWSLGWEDYLEEGMATHSVFLPGESPWSEESGWLQPMGSQRVGHDWATKHSIVQHTHTYRDTRIYSHICATCAVCLVTQSCPTLCNPTDNSPRGFSVNGNIQARILEWIAIPSSRTSSQLRDQTQVSWIAGIFLPAKPPGKPTKTGVGSLSFLQGIFPAKNGTRVSCIAGRFFTSWATREAHIWQSTLVFLPGKSHGEAWWATVHGVTKSQTCLITEYAHIYTYIYMCVYTYTHTQYCWWGFIRYIQIVGLSTGHLS